MPWQWSREPYFGMNTMMIPTRKSRRNSSNDWRGYENSWSLLSKHVKQSSLDWVCGRFGEGNSWRKSRVKDVPTKTEVVPGIRRLLPGAQRGQLVDSEIMQNGCKDVSLQGSLEKRTQMVKLRRSCVCMYDLWDIVMILCKILDHFKVYMIILRYYFYILIYAYDRFKEAQVRSAWLQEDSDEHPAVPEPEVRMPLEILVRRNRVEDSVTSLEQEKRFRGNYNCQLCPDKILINQKHMEVLKHKLLVSLMRCCLPVTALHLCEVSVPLAVAPPKLGAQAQRETFWKSKGRDLSENCSKVGMKNPRCVFITTLLTWGAWKCRLS